MHESEKVMKEMQSIHTRRNVQQRMTEHKLAVKCGVTINRITANARDAQHWGRDIKWVGRWVGWAGWGKGLGIIAIIKLFYIQVPKSGDHATKHSKLYS